MRMRTSAEIADPPAVRDELSQKDEARPMAKVVVSSGAAGEIVLGRSQSEELVVEFAIVVRLSRRDDLANGCRFVNIGARRDKGVLQLCITESPEQRDKNGQARAHIRVAVPENVKVEFASESSRIVCEELPAILILRNAGSPSSEELPNPSPP